nr:MAG TPA: hypothetical protein [Caudoviricetes sp.]
MYSIFFKNQDFLFFLYFPYSKLEFYSLHYFIMNLLELDIVGVEVNLSGAKMCMT